MKRLALTAAVLAVIGVAVGFSRPQPDPAAAPAGAAQLRVTTDAKNPWTGLKLNNDPNQFQFVIVSDRTGGHREKVFSKAVHQINLMQPEFVVSVGDLIEGYTQNQDVMQKQWDQFDSFTKKLDMPFFYVPGNHDLSNKEMIEYWGGRYGRSHYHFVYKNVLFVAVNSEDGKASVISPDQQAAVKKALDENKTVRWTLLFLHKPLWAQRDLATNGWAAVEKSLEGRKYTAFCGHVHRYQKYVRNGMNHYQLATTGGGSKLRGPRHGEFDHLVWVTMKNDGPLMANVMLDGILPENLELPETTEPGSPLPKLTLHPVAGRLTLDGKPVAGATVVLHGQDPRGRGERAVADALTEDDGSYRMTTIRAFDGVPAGTYRVSVAKFARGLSDEESPRGKNVLPEKFSRADASGLTVEVRAGANQFNIDLKSN